MASFIGKYDGKLDDKGRVPIPAPYRKRFDDNDKDQMVCRYDADLCCLNLFTLSAWEKEYEEIQEKFDYHKKEDKIFLQQILQEAYYVDIDSVGRILLNKELKGKINIENEVVFTGMGKYITISNKETRKENNLSAEELEEIYNTKMRKQ